MSQLKKKAICLFCSKKFSNYRHVERHMVKHTQERPYNCPVCHMEFERTEILAKHHCDPMLKAPSLSQSQPSKAPSSLSSVIPMHKEKERFKCDSCPVSFNSLSSVARHKNSKRCKGNGKKTGNSEEVKLSARTTSATATIPKQKFTRFQCETCSVTFTKLCNLTRHKTLKRCKGSGKETENIKKVRLAVPITAAAIPRQRVKCDSCQATFSSSSNLAKHKKRKICQVNRKATGNNEKVKLAAASKTSPAAAVSRQKFKIFKCDNCPGTFKSLVSLNMHKKLKWCERRKGYLEVVKAERGPSKQKIRFKNTSSYRRISASKTNGIKCPVCQRSFSTNGNLSRHKRYGNCNGVPVAKKMEKLAFSVISTRNYNAETQEKSKSSARIPTKKNVTVSSRPASTPTSKPKEKNVTPSSRSAFAPVKKYRCFKCSSIFLSRDFLKKHYVESHDMKLWSCKLCLNWYFRVYGLQRHMIKKHKGKMEAYRCRLCKRKFASLEMLKRHDRFHVKKNYECGVCHYTFMRLDGLREHSKRSGHSTEGVEKLPEKPSKAPGPYEEKKRTCSPERKSKRVRKPKTPYSPSMSPVAARNKKSCSPSPDITKPKFSSVSTAITTTVIKPKFHKKLEFVEKPKPKPAQQEVDTQTKSTISSTSISILRPPVFQFKRKPVFSPQVPPEFPKMELLPSPLSSLAQVQAKNLRHDVLHQFREQQQQKQKQQKQAWDESFFLHMNRYTPES